MKFRILIFLLIANPVFSQEFKEIALKTKINEVTVFLQGAQVYRTATASIPAGKSTLVAKGLSPYLEAKSIQVKGEGSFTILSVSHRLNYLDRLHKDRKIDSLQNHIKEIDQQLARSSNRLQVLSEKLSLLNVNKSLGGTSGMQLMQLKEALEFYEKEISSIKKEELDVNNQIAAYKEQKNRLQLHINEVNSRQELPTGEIEIRVDSKAQSAAKFEISYMVANAGWFPKYDVKVSNVSSPLTLKYKADVFQNTGVDWTNVKLKLSNGNPDKSGLMPDLSTWYLDYVRNTIYKTQMHGLSISQIGKVSGKVMDETGVGLPGVNVIAKGTTVGTVTDQSGNYSLTLPNNTSTLTFSFIGYMSEEVAVNSSVINLQMVADVAQLNEMVVTGYGSDKKEKVSIRGAASLVDAETISTTVIENPTTVEFEVPMPYSISSNGEKLTVDLQQHSIEAMYEYFAVPKLDKDAFLMARAANWGQYNLLQGEANLYFEDAYVGSTILNANLMSDTLDISLGRDRNIVIERSKVEEFSKQRTIGMNKVDTRGFQITVKNKKSQPVRLTLLDQLPKSVNSEINVSASELSGGILDEPTGQIKWEVDLDSQQQQKIVFKYEVRYPKHERIWLE